MTTVTLIDNCDSFTWKPAHILSAVSRTRVSSFATSDGVLRLDFDRRLMLQFRGSVVTSDAGLLAYRELDDASVSVRWRRTSSPMHVQERTAAMRWRGLLRQAVFGRLAGCEDVNDAERLRNDPAMWCIGGGKAAAGCAASASQMGRFVTRWLAAEQNTFRCSVIFQTDGSTVFMAVVHREVFCLRWIRAKSTYGEQETSVWNGHYACTCYHCSG